jgi:hypothetical protein
MEPNQGVGMSSEQEEKNVLRLTCPKCRVTPLVFEDDSPIEIESAEELAGKNCSSCKHVFTAEEVDSAAKKAMDEFMKSAFGGRGRKF